MTDIRGLVSQYKFAVQNAVIPTKVWKRMQYYHGLSHEQQQNN